MSSHLGIVDPELWKLVPAIIVLPWPAQPEGTTIPRKCLVFQRSALSIQTKGSPHVIRWISDPRFPAFVTLCFEKKFSKARSQDCTDPWGWWGPIRADLYYHESS